MTLIDKAKSCGAQIDRSMPIAIAVFAQHELEAFAALIRREALEESNALREVAKSSWRAMCDAEAVIRTIDPESAAEGEGLRQLSVSLSDIALSLFTLLREPTLEWASARRSLADEGSTK